MMKWLLVIGNGIHILWHIFLIWFLGESMKGNHTIDYVIAGIFVLFLIYLMHKRYHKEVETPYEKEEDKRKEL